MVHCFAAIFNTAARNIHSEMAVYMQANAATQTFFFFVLIIRLLIFIYAFQR